MSKKYFIIAAAIAAAGGARANECLRYKTLPSLEIKDQRFSVSVVQPPENIDLMHGNVVATFAEEYEIEYGAQRIGAVPDGGWCVFIERIGATVGYADFVIQIDRRHAFDSCEWAAIKEHEDEHVRAHISVMADSRAEIRRMVEGAAANILPVFVQHEDEIDGAMEHLENELSAQPQMKLMRQKLAAEQEIRNKKVDQGDRGWRIRQCAGH